MFFANYLFHKFGVEICFISTVLTVWKRQDFFGSVYAILLLILLIISFKSRDSLARCWKPYTVKGVSCIISRQFHFEKIFGISYGNKQKLTESFGKIAKFRTFLINREI